MIVTLNLKRNRQSVADIDESRILFASFHQQMLAVARQRFNERERIFVAAMLRPHHRENS